MYRTKAAAVDETKEAEKRDEEKENDVVALMRRAHRLRSDIDSSLMSSSEVSVDLKKKTCTDEALGSLLERRLQQSRDKCSFTIKSLTYASYAMRTDYSALKHLQSVFPLCRDVLSWISIQFARACLGSS